MSVEVICGDSREVLRTLDENSVQCCVTSPPYFGLRDYGVDGQIGLEPSPDAYVAEMARARIHADAPLFSETRTAAQREVQAAAVAEETTRDGGRGGLFTVD